MEVLSRKYCGRILICEECGTLLGNIQESDIYANNIVYCPICRHGNYINYDKAYDGVVNNDNVISN